MNYIGGKHFMKKGYVWAGIIGALTIADFLISGASFFSKPKDLLLVNIATAVADILWICLGLFLMAVFLKGHQNEDKFGVPVKPAPDSPGDIGLLKKRRNWIFGFVIIVGIIESTQFWILNDYSVGLTLNNVEAIFDILMNLIFIYAIIELFRNKKDVTTLLLYVIPFYTLVEAVMASLRGNDWASVVLNVLTAAYFIYAIKTPVNRKTFRIAQLVMLPILIVLNLASGSLGSPHLNALSLRETNLEQEFGSVSGDLGSEYGLFLQAQTPTILQAQNVQKQLTLTDEKLQELVDALNDLQAEYLKQPGDVVQQEKLEQIHDFLTILNLDKQQYDSVGELMTYVNGLDLTKLTDEQKTNINSMEQKTKDFNTQITTAQIKLSND